MTSIVDISYNSNVYSFDFDNFIISVDMDRLIVPDLYRAIRLAEVSDTGINYDTLCKGEGLAVLDEDVADKIQTSITVTLYDNWQVKSTKTSGVFKIKNGNLISNPTTNNVFAPNPLVTYIGFFSEAGTVATVSTGSGLNSEEHNKLLGIPTAIENANAVLDTDGGC